MSLRLTDTLLLSLVAAWSMQGWSQEDHTIHSFEVIEGAAHSEISESGPAIPLAPENLDRLDLLLVQNRGDYAWEIIRNSYPVLGNQFRFANALPDGVRSECNLAGWGARQLREFTMSAKNLLGYEVFHLNVQIGYKAGGQLDGQGRYIGSVSLVAADYSSWWGYTVNFRVCGVTADASDSSGEPVARLGIQVCLKVATALKTVELTQMYIIDGATADVSARPAQWRDRPTR